MGSRFEGSGLYQGFGAEGFILSCKANTILPGWEKVRCVFAT